jgi:hypothetical protein
MTSRRELLKAGLAASVLPIAARAELAAGSHAASRVALYKVLYDTRFRASVEFARRAAALGLAVQATRGDVTSFWYHDLYHRWRQEPVAIAGLTAHGALFCLERLAWDQRMRVVFRGVHSLAADGCVAHRFEGPTTVSSAAARTIAAPEWAAALADVVAEFPSGRAASHAAHTITAPASTTAWAEELFSWVIAPVQRG